MAAQYGLPLAPYPGVRDPWRDCRGLGRPGQFTEDLHVNLLMLSMEDLPFADIWLDFFKGTPRGSYSAYLHCKYREKCAADLKRTGLDAHFMLVPTVYSAWCTDLVSPMLQLLRTAMGKVPDGRLAKFVFLSSDHLPFKPFRTVQLELGKHPTASDFCIYPPSFWHHARNDSQVFAVSGTQWSVLSHMDAETLLRRMPEPTTYAPVTVPVVDGRSWNDLVGAHCIDEVAIITTIFGLIRNVTPPGASEPELVRLPGVGDVDISQWCEQGCCRSWVWMGDYNSVQWARQASPAARIIWDLLDIPEDSTVQGPSTHCQGGCEVIWVLQKLGPKGQALVRRSPFLFGRKFAHNATLEGFASVMFAS